MKHRGLGFGLRALCILAALGGAVWLALFALFGSVSAAENLPAPNYADDAAWAALPMRADYADVVPGGTGAKDGQVAASVDVFFIHPTTYYFGGRNARYDEPGEPDKRLRLGVLRFQASVYNGCCRIYAPRYRQGSLVAILYGGPDIMQASLDMAYADVARAFDYFIAHDNDGRPFILASHSQGSILGARLLAEKIAGTPLAKRLVVAYLIGTPTSISDIPGIPPCKTATETGCVIGWNSVAAPVPFKEALAKSWVNGKYVKGAGSPPLCVNPLNWQIDGSADASENLGSIPTANAHALNELPTPLPGVLDAKCIEHHLVVDVPADDQNDWPKMAGGSYHFYDYGMFYMNLRKNAADRVAAYFATH